MVALQDWPETQTNAAVGAVYNAMSITGCHWLAGFL